MVCVVASPFVACNVLVERSSWSQDVLQKFAKCVKSHGVRMYGDYACSSCAAQKALFGEAFKEIDYFECHAVGDPCKALNVTSYPTWHLVDGDRITGVTPLKVLAHWTDCSKILT